MGRSWGHATCQDMHGAGGDSITQQLNRRGSHCPGPIGSILFLCPGKFPMDYRPWLPSGHFGLFVFRGHQARQGVSNLAAKMTLINRKSVRTKLWTKLVEVMEFQLSYFKSWKMMLWKCCTQYARQFGKLSRGHRTGKGQFSSRSKRKAMPKNVQTTAQLHSSHTLLK